MLVGFINMLKPSTENQLGKTRHANNSQQTSYLVFFQLFAKEQVVY